MTDIFKKLILVIISLMAVVLTGVLSGCGDEEVKLEFEKPKDIATADQIYPAKNESAVETSPNVNGMRFTMTLDRFTEEYNKAKRILGETDLIIKGNWKTKDNPTTDNNGVEIQYYYYDDHGVSLTATVEVQSQKLLNIGCGTTMSYFVAQEGNQNNSDLVLKKAALIAMTVCGFPDSSSELLQKIFYSTTEKSDSVWYEGFVFNLNMQNNKNDSKKSIMLFRVFPISDELKEDWKIEEYTPDES